MHTCCTWLLLYATPSHLPSICPFTRPYVLISALSMYLPPVLWAWIRAPATHFLGARILTTLTTSTPPAAFSALPQHLSSPFSVIVKSSQYLFQRGPIWIKGPFKNTLHCSIIIERGVSPGSWVLSGRDYHRQLSLFNPYSVLFQNLQLFFHMQSIYCLNGCLMKNSLRIT